MRSRRLTLLAAALVSALAAWPVAAFAATDPGLASAGNFAVLAGTTVTNTGGTVIFGQLGVAPGSAVTGFYPPGRVGTQHKADSVATTAQTDLVAAYTNASTPAQPCPAANNKTGVNLGGMTLAPGVYCQTTAPTLTGTLTLNGAGIYIFQIGSTLVTAPGASISLIGGALPCQVFWQVASSATIATSTSFVGNIMALTSIQMQTGASLNGRALARNGGVTLDTNSITQPGGCGYAAGVAPAALALPAASGTGLPDTAGPPSPQPGLPWLPIALASLVTGVLVTSMVWRRRRA